jgi:SAM-dependent methyltransferase
LPTQTGQTLNSRLYPPRSSPAYIHLTDLRKALAGRASEVSGRVLDYGCGDKPYAILFGNATEYIGADFPDNPHADIRLGSEGRLPDDIGDFDCIVSTQVLEHVPNIGLYLSECRRALERRAGTLLLTTHGIWEYHPYPKDMYRWTHEGLARTIEQFGFETCAVEPVTRGFRALLQILELMIDARKYVTRWPRGIGRLLIRWQGMDRLIELFNYAADRMRDSPNVEAFRDFPLAYLYVGKVRS